MNKKYWFRKYGTPNKASIPVSVEGWLWSVLIIGIVVYLGLNITKNVWYIVGILGAIIIGKLVVNAKSK